jgi:hypothetical protein
MSPAIVNALTALDSLGNNAFTKINGYTSESGKVADYLIRAATATESVYTSTVEELKAVKFEDLDLTNWVPLKGKNAFNNAKDQFEYCINCKIATLEKTISGDRSGSHREGHDRCSRSPRAGVTVDLVTEKVGDIKVPVQTSEGLFVAAGVRLHGVVMSENVIVEGEKKVVNSGSKVLMDNAIDKVLNRKRTDLRTFSLNEGKFGSINSGSVAL